MFHEPCLWICLYMNICKDLSRFLPLIHHLLLPLISIRLDMKDLWIFFQKLIFIHSSGCFLFDDSSWWCSFISISINFAYWCFFEYSSRWSFININLSKWRFNLGSFPWDFFYHFHWMILRTTVHLSKLFIRRKQLGMTIMFLQKILLMKNILINLCLFLHFSKF